MEPPSQEAWHASAFAEDFRGGIFATQRRLRNCLLDRGAIRYAHARDLAAHMLLRLDDLPGCWSVATNWLRAELGCQRVDTGFGIREARDYFPGFAEAKDGNFDVPSFGCGRAVDNRDSAMQAMWLEPRPLIFADIKQDSRVTIRLRQRMSGARTKSKLAWALRTEHGGYGLICADWTEHLVPWESGLYDCFEQTVTDVLSPIIAVAKQIADQESREAGKPPGSLAVCAGVSGPASLAALTASELEVARLVAKGMSYKEIARVRDRSLSTIDHQLRSIRQKTGASSTSALISLLARADLL